MKVTRSPGGALTNRINTIMTDIPESFLVPHHTEKMVINEEVDSIQTPNLPMSRSWTSQPPENYDVIFLKATWSIVFLLEHPKGTKTPIIHFFPFWVECVK